MKVRSHYTSTNKGKSHEPTTLDQRKRRIEHWEIIALYLCIYDIIAVNFSYFFGLWLRFDLEFSQIPAEYLHGFLKFAPIYTVITIFIFWKLRLYRSLWRFASFNELNRILAANGITILLQVIGMTVFIGAMPMSYYIIGALVQVSLITGVRFAYRYIKLGRARRDRNANAVHNAMIIGAGAAGHVILRELKKSNKTDIRPVCIIDDNSNKWGRLMEGVPIVGGRESILEMAEKYKVNQIMFAIPTASAKSKKKILDICKETGCELKSLPGVYQLANGDVSLSKMKAVDVVDLLGREPISVSMNDIFRSIRDKIILVTGGGGSIGSELCRQVAAHEPKHLIILDIYENNAYEIEQELRRRHPELNLSVLIGSVRDTRRVDWVFQTYRPEIVYHAAAHKHVPLMETSPHEAIINNVFGTYKTAYAALKYGAKRFILISTDKAVNPTNIMGASKRLCEMVIQSMDLVSRTGRTELLPFHRSGTIADPVAIGSEQDITALPEICSTRFVAVRFGNVLGSNGSVVPLFKKQIEEGGPVTVTHPDITRYFMTIPEAVSLVLQAGSYALGGEIFVLDMGKPVKIDTLARNLIKLSGYRPDEDIPVIYTGLRPGEKLYEEKLMAEEGLKKTENDLIHIGQPIPFDTETFLQQLQELIEASLANSREIVQMVEDIVPTYHPSGKKDIEKKENVHMRSG